MQCSWDGVPGLSRQARRLLEEIRERGDCGLQNMERRFWESFASALPTIQYEALERYAKEMPLTGEDMDGSRKKFLQHRNSAVRELLWRAEYLREITELPPSQPMTLAASGAVQAAFWNLAEARDYRHHTCVRFGLDRRQIGIFVEQLPPLGGRKFIVETYTWFAASRSTMFKTDNGHVPHLYELMLEGEPVAFYLDIEFRDEQIRRRTVMSCCLLWSECCKRLCEAILRPHRGNFSPMTSWT